MSDALIAAITGGDAATVRKLVRHDPALASARDESGLPVVLLALFHRQREAADALLAAAPDLGVLEAAATGRADLLRELLAASPGAIRERTPEGFTPLGLAAFLGGPEAVRVLLEHRADADDDADNQFGVRPVHAAAAAHDPETMRLLLEAGADPNLPQRGGFTPLHEAAHTDDVEMARLLLAHGADPGIAADDGRDSVRMAADDGSSRVAALLTARSAPGRSTGPGPGRG
jgi:ankyrin repeat protein